MWWNTDLTAINIFFHLQRKYLSHELASSAQRIYWKVAAQNIYFYSMGKFLWHPLTCFSTNHNLPCRNIIFSYNPSVFMFLIISKIYKKKKIKKKLSIQNLVSAYKEQIMNKTNIIETEEYPKTELLSAWCKI